MYETKYYVAIDDNVIATDIPLETSLMITKAFFEQYYNKPDMSITLTRINKE